MAAAIIVSFSILQRLFIFLNCLKINGCKKSKDLIDLKLKDLLYGFKSKILQISVIIVNFNVRYFLEQCLLSVQAALKNLDGEIIVVDNSSTDGSKSFFPEHFQDIRYIYNEENKGFARANNQAISVAKGDYILFLNPDTLLPEDCLEKCISFLKSMSNQGALGVRMIDSEGNFLKESKRSFPDPLTSFYKLSGLTSLFPESKRFGRYYLSYLDEYQNHKVDVLSGAFMLLPRNILEKVKGFDEDFFMYGEDVDLSYRIQSAGFANYYFSETTIIHFKGESTSRGSLNYVKMFYRAMSVFVRKHYKSGKAGAYNLFIQIGILLRGIVSAFSRFLTWVGVPVIDVLAILLSFWVAKKLWALYLLPYLAFDRNILLVLFPFYTIIFLTTGYFSGLYDNGYRQKRMNIAFALSILILFTIYALVPNSDRFSRGMLLTAVSISFLLMTLIRFLLTSFNVIKKAERNQGEKLVVIGSRSEYEAVTRLLTDSGNGGNVIGWIGDSKGEESQTGDCERIRQILKTTLVDKVIFCHGLLSYKQIVQSVDQLPGGISAAFYSANASAIIGSKYKSLKGVYDLHEHYKLSDPVVLRVKRLTDIGIALLFLLTFPVHLIRKKNPISFFRNCIIVILNKKTFVGYASGSASLPPLKPGILTTIRQSENRNYLPSRFLIQSDKIYAKSYTVLTDLKIILHGYQRLS